MTQDVQPLTWQKRTNLEEHQQFFSKINEIIANLAPTVDEAEAAIAQATQAIADANAAIATANAASAAADAAAQQAQTAAATVAGYNTRLTAAEGSITSLSGRMTSAESKNNQQDTAITALQTADAQNVKIDRINDYAVGLTGNQIVYGNKTHVSNVPIRVPFRRDENPTSTTISASFLFTDDQGNNIGGVSTSKEANGNTRMYITLVNNVSGAVKTGSLRFSVTADGTTSLQLIDTSNNYHTIASF